MLIPNTRLFAAGDVLTGTMLNQTVSSMGNFLLGKPIAYLLGGTTTSMGTGADTAIALDTETIDRDNGHSNTTNNTRYTAATPGWYRCNGLVTFAASSGGTYREAKFRTNGSTVVTGSPNRFRPATLSATGNLSVPTSCLVYLNGTTDYLELVGSHDAGAALLTVASTPFFSAMQIEWVSL